MHTGDFKFDYTPVDRRQTDFAKLAELGSQGVLCLFADSTNADRPGYTPSERVVGEALDALIGRARGRVIITTFASLISRIQQIIDTAAKYERKVGVVGRSMVQNVTIAQELGYLTAPPGVLLKPDEIGQLKQLPPQPGGGDHHRQPGGAHLGPHPHGQPRPPPDRDRPRGHRDHVRRGHPRQRGARLPHHRQPVPPGRQRLLGRTTREVHVSGHASQEELKLMLSLVRPQYFVPVHGEYRHLILHARLAQSLGVPAQRIFVIEDGEVLELSAESAEVAEHVSAGYVFVDGLGVGDVGQVVLRDRQALAQDGILIVTITVDRHTGLPVAGPDIVSRGFVYVRENEELVEKARAQVQLALQSSPAVSKDGEARQVDWQYVKNKIRDVLSRFVYEQTRRRPMILPLVMEV